MRIVLAWMAMALLAGAVSAQAEMAQTPRQGARALHAELPTAEQPMRRVPTTGYTLAMTWTPEYCHAPRGDRALAPECVDRRLAGGFTLHGLWPDGDGPNRWPQYCHPVALLTEGQTLPVRDVTPSAQLRQHEWAKHGSCMTSDPARYFAEEAAIYRRIVSPDMRALARRRDLTAGDVTQAFAAANPGMQGNMLRLNVNRRGWMEEVWLCLGLDKRPRPCRADAGGAPAGSSVRIQAAEYGSGYGSADRRRRQY